MRQLSTWWLSSESKPGFSCPFLFTHLPNACPFHQHTELNHSLGRTGWVMGGWGSGWAAPNSINNNSL